MDNGLRFQQAILDGWQCPIVLVDEGDAPLDRTDEMQGVFPQISPRALPPK